MSIDDRLDSYLAQISSPIYYPIDTEQAKKAILTDLLKLIRSNTMSRTYITSPMFYEDRFTEKVIQPDRNLINTLHALLDTIPNEKVALTIDLCVSELLRFHNPNLPMPFTAKELIAMQENISL